MSLIAIFLSNTVPTRGMILRPGRAVSVSNFLRPGRAGPFRSEIFPGRAGPGRFALRFSQAGPDWAVLVSDFGEQLENPKIELGFLIFWFTHCTSLKTM